MVSRNQPLSGPGEIPLHPDARRRRSKSSPGISQAPVPDRWAPLESAATSTRGHRRGKRPTGNGRRSAKLSGPWTERGGHEGTTVPRPPEENPWNPAALPGPPPSGATPDQPATPQPRPSRARPRAVRTARPPRRAGTASTPSWTIGLFGTAVGAGILFLPINAGLGGMWPLIIATVLIWPMTYFSHRALSRMVVASREPGPGHHRGGPRVLRRNRRPRGHRACTSWRSSRSC